MSGRRPDDHRALAHVRELVGVRYAFQSRDPDIGLDCLTLCEEVYRRIGRVFPLPERYGVDHVDGAVFLDWAQHFDELEGQEPWAFVDMGAAHCGVLMPDGCVIHCRDTTGVVAQPAARLASVIDGFWRLLP